MNAGSEGIVRLENAHFLVSLPEWPETREQTVFAFGVGTS